jgi:hypothetical protein
MIFLFRTREKWAIKFAIVSDGSHRKNQSHPKIHHCISLLYSLWYFRFLCSVLTFSHSFSLRFSDYSPSSHLFSESCVMAVPHRKLNRSYSRSLHWGTPLIGEKEALITENDKLIRVKNEIRQNEELTKEKRRLNLRKGGIDQKKRRLMKNKGEGTQRKRQLNSRPDPLLSALALTVYIRFPLILLFISRLSARSGDMLSSM